MQNRIREIRSTKSDGRNGRQALACFGKFKLIVFFCLLQSGCSLLRSKVYSSGKIDSEVKLEQLLSKICWSADGKARFQTSKEKHLVSFTSVLDNNVDRDKSSWKIGVRIPFKGEEVITLDFGHKNKTQNYVKDFKGLFTTFIDFIILTQSKDKKCAKSSNNENWHCELSNESSSVEIETANNELIIRNNLESNIENQVELHASKLNAKGFFEIVEIKNQQSSSNMFEAKFFINSCSNIL